MIMIMIMSLDSAFSGKGSTALYNESQGEGRHQPVKAPRISAAIRLYVISPHHPANEYR